MLSTKKRLEEALDLYIQELKSVEDFQKYFNGYETEDGDYIQGDIYHIAWTLEDNNPLSIYGELEYNGARVLTGYGGPNTYIDTNSSMIGIWWGGYQMEKPMPSKLWEKLDEYFASLFELKFKNVC